MTESGLAKEKWHEICFILSSNISPNIKESVYEQKVIMALEKLGWSQFKEEIQSQKRLEIAWKTALVPDIVIFGPDKKALVVIEVKRPSKRGFDKRQLIAYMRQMQADFGLFVGKDIRIYYDGILKPTPNPMQLEKIPFKSSSSAGEKFVEIFTKTNFLNEQHKNYLKEKIDRLTKKEKIDKLKKEICTEGTKREILEFLKSKYAEIGQDIVSEAIENLKIKISYKDDTPKKTTATIVKDKFDEDVQICKIKKTGKVCIYIEDPDTRMAQVLIPNGKLMPYDPKQFSKPEYDESIKNLLSQGEITTKEAEVCLKLLKKPKRPKDVRKDIPFGLPPRTPKMLIHTLEVIHTAKTEGISRVEATQKVAQKYDVLYNTIADKYGRQLQKSAAEIDQLLEQPDLAELRSVLEQKYVHHREAIRSFFEQIDRP